MKIIQIFQIYLLIILSYLHVLFTSDNCQINTMQDFGLQAAT